MTAPVTPGDLALRLKRSSARAAGRGPSAPFSEVCPSCGADIPESDAWCRTCGSSRGVSESTPAEAHLLALVAALELVRQSSRRVRPLPEVREAERLLEQAVGRLRGEM
jgi:hypothetical protein